MSLYMTVHGMMQHEQSSPHQQGSLTGALTPFTSDGAGEEPEADALLEVDGGMFVVKRGSWDAEVEDGRR